MRAWRIRGDFGLPDLDQRRAHACARQAAQHNERLLHAVVHVDEGICIEHARQWLDAIVEAASLGKVVSLYSLEKIRLQVRDHAAAARKQAVAAKDQGGEQPGAMGGEHVHLAGQVLQRAHVPLVMLHVADPILDGPDCRHLFTKLEERFLGITLAGTEWVLEDDKG